jgi:hypothetical protein
MQRHIPEERIPKPQGFKNVETRKTQSVVYVTVNRSTVHPHYLQFKKSQINALGYMNIILLHKNHRHVSTNHVVIFRVVNRRLKRLKVKGGKAGFIQHCSSLKPIVLSPLMQFLPSSPEAPPHQSAREPSTSEGRNLGRNLARKS